MSAPTAASTRGGDGAVVGVVVRRVLFYAAISLVMAFFALPLLWLVFAPFDRTPSLTVRLPDFTLDNFRLLQDNPYALTSLRNSIFIAGTTMVLVVVFAALAAYALSRVHIPGRDGLLYALLLLSSIVTGTAAMVPIFLLMFQLNLIDSRTGVSLVLAGGLLPAAIFILKDFMDATPRSYEESARVFGASPLQVLRHVVLPIARPGLATIAVWALVNTWGDFLIAFILLRDPEMSVEVAPAGTAPPALPPAPPLPPAAERRPPRALPSVDGLSWRAGDFHSDTVHSDGTLTVAQLAQLGAAQGLDFLAVTDHNTISHHSSLAAAGAAAGIQLVPGQELTTGFGHANAFGDVGWIDFREPADTWWPGPLLLRVGGEVVALGGDGAVLTGPDVRRRIVRGDTATFPAGGGPHWLEDHETRVLAVSC
ncbi:MAG: multiple sugar transport system permease protein [Actinomycetota bacterium]|nr:multiple sugar transport system permease protein [Actinomycetota bacterium]